MITLGKYHICILDLLTDSKTGKLSSSKVWQHIANSIMSYAFVTHLSPDWELFVAYGGIVGASHVAIHFLKWRYRDADPDK